MIQSGHHMTTRVHPEPCRLEMGPIKRWCVADGVTSIRPVHESVAQESRQCKKHPLCEVENHVVTQQEHNTLASHMLRRALGKGHRT